jgi:hypothetical protein
MLVLKANIDTENAEGEKRLLRMQKIEGGLLMKVRDGETTSQAKDRMKKLMFSGGGTTHAPTLAAQKKKLVAQSGKFVGLVPSGDASE